MNREYVDAYATGMMTAPAYIDRHDHIDRHDDYLIAAQPASPLKTTHKECRTMRM
jgi:hypothetical protein